MSKENKYLRDCSRRGSLIIRLVHVLSEMGGSLIACLRSRRQCVES